jgi:prevent-host-death family protein
MVKRARKQKDGETTIGAYEAKTKFSDLLARAEKGERFLVTRNGKEVAKVVPVENPDHEEARRAADRILARLATAPAVSPPNAQRNWESLKHELDAEDDERTAEWLSSSTHR